MKKLICALKNSIDIIPGIEKINFDPQEYVESNFHYVKKMVPMVPNEVYIRASGIYNLCPRENVLLSKYGIDTSDKINSMTNMNFSRGSMLHEWFQNVVFRDILLGAWKCKNCDNEIGDIVNHIKFPGKCNRCNSEDIVFAELHFQNKEYKFGGHTDGFLYDNGEKVIIDFKTANTEWYNGVDKWGSPSYIWQQNGYMWLSGFNTALLVFFNKNDNNFKKKVIRRDEKIIEKIKAKCIDTISGVNSLSSGDTYELPARIQCDKKSCVRARKCPVRNDCFSLPEVKSILEK